MKKQLHSLFRAIFRLKIKRLPFDARIFILKSSDRLYHSQAGFKIPYFRKHRNTAAVGGTYNPLSRAYYRYTKKAGGSYEF